MKANHLIILLISMLLPAAVSAQSVIELWSEKSPAPHASVLKGAESAPDDGGRISNISVPTITVFSPAAAKNTGRAVIICPGGGYWLLTTYFEGSHFAKLLADNGITGVVLKNRMPAGVHQIPLEDADRAMELVRANAAEWGVDTSKIGIMGFSAGGHLAALHSTRGAVRPAFSVLFYPVISMREGITHEGSRKELIGREPLREYYSCELAVDAQTPPALLFHCEDDPGVSIANSYLYRDALVAHKKACELVVIPTGGHGWGMSDRMPEREMICEKLIDWIKKI